MSKALVCINAESGASGVLEDLKLVKGVSEVHASKGLYDFVAMIEAGSFGELREGVLHDIRRVENVKSTLTLSILEL
jgi:DNA-binding Lrp family transcriptional regulator